MGKPNATPLRPALSVALQYPWQHGHPITPPSHSIPSWFPPTSCRTGWNHSNTQKATFRFSHCIIKPVTKGTCIMERKIMSQPIHPPPPPTHDFPISVRLSACRSVCLPVFLIIWVCMKVPPFLLSFLPHLVVNTFLFSQKISLPV